MKYEVQSRSHTGGWFLVGVYSQRGRAEKRIELARAADATIGVEHKYRVVEYGAKKNALGSQD